MKEGIFHGKFAELVTLKIATSASLLIFAVLYLLISGGMALGFAYGVTCSLLILWLNWEGLNRLREISEHQNISVEWGQRTIVLGYVVRYILVGVLFWVSVCFDWLNFYAVCGGFLLPQTVIRVNTLFFWK